MKKTLTTLRVIGLLAAAAAVPAGAPAFAQEPTPTIEEKTAGMQVIPGFIPLFWEDATGKLYAEFGAMDEEFLYQVSLASGLGSNPVGPRPRPVEHDRDLPADPDRAAGAAPRTQLPLPARSATIPTRCGRCAMRSRPRSIGGSRWRRRPTTACWWMRPTSSCGTPMERRRGSGAPGRGASPWTGAGAPSTCRTPRGSPTTPRSRPCSPSRVTRQVGW